MPPLRIEGSREVYDSVTHGLVEHFDTWRHEVWDGDESEIVIDVTCPVSTGYEGACGMKLDGPYTVAALGQGQPDA